MSGDLSFLFGQAPFDPNTVEPQTDYEVLPPGKYPVLIGSAAVQATKAGTGSYIKLDMVVMDGPMKGRHVFDRINIVNQNQQAVEIAMRSLSALCRAIGLMALGDTSQLVNKACIACVKVKGEQNEVRTYEPLTPAAAPGVPQQPMQPTYMPPQAPVYAPPAPQYAPPAQPQAPPQQTGGQKPPWQR